MASLWFCVPVYGRLSLTAICLRQLRRTCDSLAENGIEATAVVIGDDANLDTARALGFGTIERDNRYLSRKFNDGIQLACDPHFNPRPANYVVPMGSDDWIDYRILLELPPAQTVLGFQRLSFVRPDGRELRTTQLRYVGGCGIRVYPRHVVARCGYRPADEDRVRGCDTSILTNVQKVYGHRLSVAHGDTDALQIVDWKSRDEQITTFESIFTRHEPHERADPFEVLADVFPTDALHEMTAHYGRTRELVSA